MTRKLLAMFLIATSLVSLIIFAGIPISASNFTNIPAVSALPDTSHNQISVDETYNGVIIGLSVGDNLV